jgi:rubrerythrin
MDGNLHAKMAVSTRLVVGFGLGYRGLFLAFSNVDNSLGEVMMSKSWIQGWRRLVGLPKENKALEILRRLYVEESQHLALFAQHARGMQYPQFRPKLEKIAVQEAAHIDSIGQQIKALGGSLPVLQPSKPVGGNSWEVLRAALEDESRCAGELLEHAARLEGDFPQVAELLRSIYEDEQRHRDEIQDMLMRSDPFSRHAA